MLISGNKLGLNREWKLLTFENNESITNTTRLVTLKVRSSKRSRVLPKFWTETMSQLVDNVIDFKGKGKPTLLINTTSALAGVKR